MGRLLQKFVGPGTFNVAIDKGNANVNQSEIHVECDTALGAIVLNLPLISTIGNASAIVEISILDASNTAGKNNITVNAAVGNTINTTDSAVISTNGGLLEIEASSLTTWGASRVSSLTPSTSSKLAMFFGLTAGTGNGATTDYATTVAVKTAVGTGRVPFPRDGAMSGIVRATPSTFTLPDIGIYEVDFRVHTTEPGQLQLELDGADLASSVSTNMNPTSGGHIIVGKAFVTTTLVNQVLALVNCAGNSVALTITPADGSNTHANCQAIFIKKVG